jgi:hypothetical protein
MNFQVDKAKAITKWNPILEALYVQDENKKGWMAEYAELHSMNENVSYATLGNVQGMGSVWAAQPSATPGQVWGGGDVPGSGDIGQNLLPVSMKIAAQTIGLDLVAVKPAASPKVDLLFVDFRYDDNNDDASDRPLVFKLSATNGEALQTALKGQLVATATTERVGGLDKRNFISLTSTAGAGLTAPDDKQNIMEFLGFSRIDGLPMFRIFRQANELGNSLGFVATKNTFANNGTSIVATLASSTIYTLGATSSTILSGATIDLVSLMEDHIPGFSAGWNLNKGMNRATDETTYPGQIGPNVFTKTIQVGDLEITSALKRTEIEDIKASTGMDIVQKLESVLINELSQNISKEIVEKVKELAEKNRASYTVPKVGTVSKFDFNVDTYLSGGWAPGGETTHSLQRKLISKVNNGSNYIANEGRVGPAQYIVTNGNLASVLQDTATYALASIPGGSNLNTNGQLYPVGKINNMTLYVDPYMRWDDNRIFLGRKNSVDQPGLLFLPYLMAQSISLISEATWAPRMMIRSRYAVADIGFFPEKQFLALHVTDTNGVLI